MATARSPRAKGAATRHGTAGSRSQGSSLTAPATIPTIAMASDAATTAARACRGRGIASASPARGVQEASEAVH